MDFQKLTVKNGMYKAILFTFIWMSFCAISCNEKKQATIETEKIALVKNDSIDFEEKKEVELLEKCIDAHGGMEKWNSFVALEYNLDDKGKTVYQITHLKDRRAYLKSKEYEVGFDGKVAWAIPDARKVSGKSAAFYYNLDFYFMGIPFLLKDPGVIPTYFGRKTVDGNTYEVLKIAFGSGIGLTPEDVYYLYIDPESFMLKILTYSISYFDKKEAKINSAKVYSDYQEVQGLMMPSKMENFEWADGVLGKSKNHIRLFSDIRFLNEIPDQQIFEVPEEAIVEQVN